MLPTRNYSATDTAITQRPTSTALLCIDSEDRYADYPEARDSVSVAYNNDPYSFTINRNESIMNGFFTRVGLTEVVFPWTIPNINPHTNKIIVTYTAGGPVAQTPITLLPGFYTPSQLAAAIQIAVRAIGGGAILPSFTMTYGDQNLNIFSYGTNVVGHNIAFSPMPLNVNVADPNYYPYGPTTKQLFDVLGFNNGNTVLFSDEGSGGATFCQAIRYIDIVCEQLTNNQALKDTMSQPVARDSLCRLYLTDPGSTQSTVSPSSSTFCPPGCAPMTIYRNFSQPKQIQWLPNQPIVGSLRFSVYDDNGTLLSESDPFVPSGSQKNNWSISLLITEN